MRALIIGPEEREAAAKVVAYAMEPEHWYHPSLSEVSPVPGDNPAFRVQIPHGYRCVFTVTAHDSRRWRHLTVSVDGPLYPSPEAVVEIAGLFGFTGPADEEPLPHLSEMVRAHGWQFGMGHPGEHCIAVMQRLPETADR